MGKITVMDVLIILAIAACLVLALGASIFR